MAVTGAMAVTGVLSAPTATVGTSTTQAATTAFVQAAIAARLPSGVITMWSGSIASIPSGWLLCNGTSGTPDLRDRFVVGAGSTYAVASTGGSANAVVVSHTHGVTDPGHVHSITFVNEQGSGNLFDGGVFGRTVAKNTVSAATGISIQTAGVSGTNANLPPYYALAYIMKA